ncbi:MAG: hypothetical protein AAFO69_08980 [Bacteroidota bacterium]
MQLSKEASELLQDHSYRLRYSVGGLIISKWSLDKVVLHGFLLFFLLLAGVIATAINISIGIVAWLLIGTIAIWQYRSSRRKIKLSIDKDSRDIQIADVKLQLSGVESLDFNSRFVASYTSAFKDTNEEHSISICLTTSNGNTYEIISFKSDYAEPCAAIQEIGFLIKNEIAQLRPAM